jgi:hypothetical protein
MLVVEHRHDPAVLLEGAGDLLEKPSPRIEVLAELVRRVVAVLADTEDAVDGYRLTAHRHGLLDRIEEGHVVLLAQIPG